MEAKKSNSDHVMNYDQSYKAFNSVSVNSDPFESPTYSQQSLAFLSFISLLKFTVIHNIPHLRATLPKNLIFNFHPEIDFADNSSTKFFWQEGNKYEIRSGKFNFLKIF